MDMPKVLEDLRGQLGHVPLFKATDDLGAMLGQVTAWMEYSSKLRQINDLEALWTSREATLEASAEQPDEGGAEFTSTVRARAMRRGVRAGSARSASGSGTTASDG